MLMNLEPERIDDIIAAIALYRPGPMESIPTFIACRHHPEQIRYATPLLEPILRSTYGCVVYQEQVMQIFREVAGYTFGHADVVRRAMSKKKAAVLLAERENFVTGAIERGVARETAETLFSDMESFANYAFNKSHAAAYAVLCYRTAYLKQHYPCEYLCALLTSVLGSQTKVAEYIAECTARGIRVLPPDINESRTGFAVANGDIRFGLLAIRNVGRQFLEQILEERRNGPFSSFEDFIDRMNAGTLNKRMVEALIKAGTFDRLGVFRSRLLASYERIIDQAAEKGRNNLAGQLDMFSTLAASPVEHSPRFSYPPLPDLSVREKLLMEREATGMFFSGQLLDGYSRHLAVLAPTSIAELVGENAEPTDRQRVTVAGMITSVTVKNTKSGERMAFFKLEDQYGEIECVVFARAFAAQAHLVRTDFAVAVTGTVSLREDEPPRVLVARMEELVENAVFQESKKRSTDSATGDGSVETPTKRSTEAPRSSETAPARPRRLFLRVPNRTGKLWVRVQALMAIFDGAFPVAIYDADLKQYDFDRPGLALDDYVLAQFRDLLGEENVILK